MAICEEEEEEEENVPNELPNFLSLLRFHGDGASDCCNEKSIEVSLRWEISRKKKNC